MTIFCEMIEICPYRSEHRAKCLWLYVAVKKDSFMAVLDKGGWGGGIDLHPFSAMLAPGSEE